MPGKSASKLVCPFPFLVRAEKFVQADLLPLRPPQNSHSILAFPKNRRKQDTRRLPHHFLPPSASLMGSGCPAGQAGALGRAIFCFPRCQELLSNGVQAAGRLCRALGVSEGAAYPSAMLPSTQPSQAGLQPVELIPQPDISGEHLRIFAPGNILWRRLERPPPPLPAPTLCPTFQASSPCSQHGAIQCLPGTLPFLALVGSSKPRGCKFCLSSPLDSAARSPSRKGKRHG